MGFTALDRIDYEIIRLLQKDAWMSNKQIAAAVRLAPSTCHERVRNLRKRGVIRGAHAKVDPRSIGLGLEALAFIKLGNYERAVINQFMDNMQAIPEVRSVFLVNGRYDVILYLTVKDVDHLKNLGLDRITNQPVVVNIESSIVYESRSRNELPVLIDARQSKDTPAGKGSTRSSKARSRSR